MGLETTCFGNFTGNTVQFTYIDVNAMNTLGLGFDFKQEDQTTEQLAKWSWLCISLSMLNLFTE